MSTTLKAAFEELKNNKSLPGVKGISWQVDGISHSIGALYGQRSIIGVIRKLHVQDISVEDVNGTYSAELYYEKAYDNGTDKSGLLIIDTSVPTENRKMYTVHKISGSWFADTGVQTEIKSNNDLFLPGISSIVLELLKQV